MTENKVSPYGFGYDENFRRGCIITSVPEGINLELVKTEITSSRIINGYRHIEMWQDPGDSRTLVFYFTKKIEILLIN